MPLSNEARIILSHQRVVAEVRTRVVEYVTQQWKGMGSWHGDDVDSFLAKVVPVVESGQKQVYQLTSVYLDSIARVQGMPPSKSPTVIPKVLRGATPREVYRRPFLTTWNALSEGKPIGEAVDLGAQRVESLVSTDLQMANVRSAFDKLSGDKNVVGYSRVLNETDATCALCIIASTQRYHTGDLMPIHPGCQCDVEPLYGEDDPGQVINAERLSTIDDALKEQLGITDTHGGTGDNTQGTYRDLTQIKVQMHGDTGPTLTWADQNFTGAADIAAVGPDAPGYRPDGTFVSHSSDLMKVYDPNR